jgi:tetratricopeptide (TPR) repeat protein
MRFVAQLKASPIAIHTREANEQHYELPSEFSSPTGIPFGHWQGRSCASAREPLAFGHLWHFASPMLFTRSCPRIAQRIVMAIALGVGASPTVWCAEPQQPPRPASQQEYWAQYDKRDWAATIAAAQALVATARERAAEQPIALAEALSMLGDAQLHNGDYVSAQASYDEALELVERTAGSASGHLLAPLRGLGLSYALSGQHDRAVPYLERGLLIVHRTRGLYDTSQQPLLRQLVASHTATGDLPEAQRQANYLLRVGERVFGKDDPRVSPLLCFVGGWYAQANDYATARLHFRRAIEIVERKLGKSSLALVEPLRGLASTFPLEIAFTGAGGRSPREQEIAESTGSLNEPRPGINPRTIDEEGERALLRAVKILDAQPDAALDDRLGTLLELGDWYQIKHRPEQGLPYYKRAATLAAQAPEDSAAAAILSFPMRVYYPTPPLATRNRSLRPDQVDERYVQVEFTVKASGDVVEAKVIDQNGTSRQAAETLEAIRAARFRPKFVNGEPVDTSGVLSREVFRMRKQSDPNAKSSSGASGSSGAGSF